MMGLFDDLQGTAAGRVDGKKNKLQVIDGGAVDDRGPGGSVKGSDGRKKQAATKTGKKTNTTKSGKQAGPGAGVVGRGSVPVVRGAVVSDAGESGAVDVVMASGVDAALLPGSVSDVGRLLPLWVAAWCDSQAVDDIRKISPLVFGGLCQTIGKAYIKPSRILKDTSPHGVGYGGAGVPCNAYDPQSVLAMYEVFSGLCASCDKVPFASDFARFCGVSVAYIREYEQNLTSLGFDIRKKTLAGEMDAIRRAASRDPVGRLAILNNEFWNGAGGSGDSVQAQAVDSIPAAASFGLLPGDKLE